MSQDRKAKILARLQKKAGQSTKPDWENCIDVEISTPSYKSSLAIKLKAARNEDAKKVILETEFVSLAIKLGNRLDGYADKDEYDTTGKIASLIDSGLPLVIRARSIPAEVQIKQDLQLHELFGSVIGELALIRMIKYTANPNIASIYHQLWEYHATIILKDNGYCDAALNLNDGTNIAEILSNCGDDVAVRRYIGFGLFPDKWCKEGKSKILMIKEASESHNIGIGEDLLKEFGSKFNFSEGILAIEPFADKMLAKQKAKIAEREHKGDKYIDVFTKIIANSLPLYHISLEEALYNLCTALKAGVVTRDLSTNEAKMIFPKALCLLYKISDESQIAIITNLSSSVWEIMTENHAQGHSASEAAASAESVGDACDIGLGLIASEQNPIIDNAAATLPLDERISALGQSLSQATQSFNPKTASYGQFYELESKVWLNDIQKILRSCAEEFGFLLDAGPVNDCVGNVPISVLRSFVDDRAEWDLM